MGRPVSFAAAVTIPRLKKRRMSVDYLGAAGGSDAPGFRRDPVHFKLVAVSVARAQGE